MILGAIWRLGCIMVVWILADYETHEGLQALYSQPFVQLLVADYSVTKVFRQLSYHRTQLWYNYIVFR